MPKSQLKKLENDYQHLQRELSAKNQLLKNTVTKADLEALQAQLAQKVTENEALKLEFKKLHLQTSESKPKPPKLQLRSKPLIELSEDEAKRMIRAYDFFDSYENENGAGITHEYEMSERNGEKILLDHTTGLMWQQPGSSISMTYANAEEYIHELNQKRFAGYRDWRLPTLEEAMSLMEPQTFGDYDPDDSPIWGIWTMDKYGSTAVWFVAFDGRSCGLADISIDLYVCAVRSEQ